MKPPYFCCLLLIMMACTSSPPETAQGDGEPIPVLTGLNGKEYYEPVWDEKTRARLDSNLNTARRNLEVDSSEENYIWFGRRLAYLYRYREAIGIFSEGLKKFPDSYKLYRHRGHRYVTLRDFDRAVADLQQAASLMPPQPLEIEPDGQPNKLNIPLSSTQFNVWYHLGLAHYLKGDFESAEKSYIQCLEVSDNDDLLCATADWLYMTYKRLNRQEEAGKVLELVHDKMNIIENDSYYLRLMLYKGLIPVESVLNVNSQNEDADLALATQGYGVGNWYLYQADTVKANEIFNRVVSGKHFAAFGFIAAEAELARMK